MVEPLLVSAGGVVAEELDESAGGAVEVDPEESAGGDAGAVAVESDGAVVLGDVDSCFEQAAIANALRHNTRRLRFIEITSLYVGDRPPRLLRSAGWNTTQRRKPCSIQLFGRPAQSGLPLQVLI